MGDRKEDFTLLENLDEFIHGEDAEVDRQLGLLKENTPPPFETPSNENEEEPPEPEFGAETSSESEDSDTSPPFESDFSLDTGPEVSSFESEADPLDLPPEPPAESEDDFSFSSDFSQGGSEGEEQSQALGGDFGESSESESESETESESGAESATEFPDMSFSNDQEETPEEESHTPSFPEEEGAEEPVSMFSAPEPASSSEEMPEKKPEQFQDIKEFAQNISYGKVEGGGNPPFSLILKGIKYKEDRDDILMILRDHDLVNEENLETTQKSLNNGSLLISHISEFSAIYLSHKFRRFDLDIFMGLSDEIHYSKSFENSKGLTGKGSLKQNKAVSINLEDNPLTIDSILVTTLPQVEGRDILKYLGVVSGHRILSEEELFREEKEKTKEPKTKKGHVDHDHRLKAGEIDWEKYSPTLSEIYDDLAKGLRQQALALQGNAVVGINYHIAPILPIKDKYYKTHFKITCTGNVVWVH